MEVVVDSNGDIDVGSVLDCPALEPLDQVEAPTPFSKFTMNKLSQGRECSYSKTRVNANS